MNYSLQNDYLSMRIFIIGLSLMLSLSLFSQDLSNDDLYKQAIENAKVAFEANQYSTAVMFYNEAQRIKPESLLPRYKIEDIRTIYIAKEMDTIALVQTAKLEEVPKKKKKKEIEAEQIVMASLAQEQATERMYIEAEKEKQELAELKVEAQTLYIEEDIEDLEDEAVEDVAPELQTGLNKIESNAVSPINTKPNEIPSIKGEVKTVEPVVVINEPKQEEAKSMVSEPKKEVVKTKPAPKPVPVKVGMSAEEKAKWVEAEKKRLVEKYPDKKTVEEIEKPGKHITRIVMHIDNKVTVYLKVKHGWGATYFFIDEPGLELKSINEQYFNLKTNLKTYEGN